MRLFKLTEKATIGHNWNGFPFLDTVYAVYGDFDYLDKNYGGFYGPWGVPVRDFPEDGYRDSQSFNLNFRQFQAMWKDGYIEEIEARSKGDVMPNVKLKVEINEPDLKEIIRKWAEKTYNRVALKVEMKMKVKEEGDQRDHWQVAVFEGVEIEMDGNT
jgi:hypothetical protein